MYPATESGRSESEAFVIDDYFFDVFIRRAPVDDNTASERIAALDGCKTLQLYEHDANVWLYDANCE